jgi:hypothetical protein
MRKAYRVWDPDNEIRIAYAMRNLAASQQPSAAARHGIDRLISSEKACRHPSYQAPLALSNLLLPLRQRNRRTCYNFAGLGIEDPHYHFMIPIVERMRRRPVQFFQPLSHLNSVLFTSLAMFTVWPVDSQAGQQVAS